ncbi:MAG: hypothetical protein MRERV_14c023 [Mycoplasmataceae bacterium RV_VA103A]|nr:MAG: hypothetical protein MRERV_14c023 [Mycoplasmataceae bacterium RV_VA103A]
MGSKKEFKNKELEVKRLDKKTFKRIKEEFKQYQKYLFGLIVVYIICYFVWFMVAEGIGDFLNSHGYDKNSRTLVIGIAILQGLLFCLDGFVTALLKSPFNQMCFAINKAEGIPYKKKTRIIMLATRANEHCKETLKKLGLISILSQIIGIFIMREGFNNPKLGIYADWLLLGYFIPLIFTTLDMMSIDRELKKIEKLQVDGYAKNKPLAKQSD